MSSDHQLDDALRALAGHGGQGRVPAVADIRRRGDTRRSRRRAASVALAAVAVVAIGTGVALTRPDATPHTNPVGPAGPTVTSAQASPSPGGSSSPPASPSASQPTIAKSDDPLLSGKRKVAIVRVAAFEGGLSLLDDGQLGEVDGDEGRQLFVFSPQGPGTYQIRTAEPGTDLTDTCWEVRSSGSEPLRIEGAPCAPDEPRQQFTVAPDDDGDGDVYVISNNSAYLQNSPTRGLILEETGDVPVTETFRLVDNGAAPE
ncbi:hypothetical protein [Micromonospora endophytica]|uniref:Uncharacterized protein n=1 Tax=Micromonospora endophytica TaxID=515350 RepID=A0A2W2D663_9ACTN|nr:hypothetical protein [Micromonospora endophytica]PZG01025.1 hypothetical protein C1I93_00605 [Micromonospora endophytica]RIW47933.1 hypothetical protein D3H59_08645 [Micromonospora endophytica]BCJ62310.1 hypothetical protein Jiend_57320 [Micromonospora endophytica]